MTIERFSEMADQARDRGERINLPTLVQLAKRRLTSNPFRCN